MPGKAFSPNTFKTRLAIAFKGLSFKTEWIELPDIEPRMKAIGAEPTTTKPDGSPMYTLPVIFDDMTGKVLSESMKIAEYLEATYPNTPSLFPFNAHAPIHLINEYFSPTVIRPAADVFQSNTMSDFKLNPPSLHSLRVYWKTIYGKTPEEVPRGETRAAMLAASKEAFSKLAAMYSANGGEKLYFFGDVPSYADFIIVAYLLWIRLGMGPENLEWKAIEEWDGGRWGKLLKVLEKYNVSA